MLADVSEQVVALAVVHEGEGSASTTEATSATNAVQVSLIICCTIGQVGNVVVDDHSDGLNIDATGKNVGGDEHLCFAGTELVEDIISLSSVQGARKGGNFVAVGSHASLDLGGSVTTLDEDNG